MSELDATDVPVPAQVMPKRRRTVGPLRVLRALLPAALRRRLSELRELTPFERRLYLRAWLRDRRGIRRALPDRARSILVICHGNIMRSALGDALLRRAAAGREDLVIRSAGVGTIPGRPADPRARRIADTLGVSLEEHRSQPVTRALVDEADVILAMDLLNEARLLARFPSAEGRLRLLGEFDPHPGRAEIPDPYLQDPTDAEQCFLRVARCVEQMSAASPFRRTEP